MDTHVWVGLHLIAYYSGDRNSKDLFADIKLALASTLDDLELTGVNVEYAKTQSSVIYITFIIIRDSYKAVGIGHIVDMLQRAVVDDGSLGNPIKIKITTDDSDCVFELDAEGNFHSCR